MELRSLQERIEKSVEEILGEKRGNRPCHTNRCSQLGDPCERRLFYHRTAWDRAVPISTGLAGIFETGNELEPLVERHLSEIGSRAKPRFRIVGQQQTTRDALFDAHKISGTVDGFLQVQTDNQWRTVAVVDIKTANPMIFESLDGVDSLSNYPWMAKYRAQLMLYALAHDLEWCVLVFVNKSNLWQFKTVVFPLDYGYAESLIRKADRINEAVENNEPPPKLNQPAECGRCEFAHICMPELVGSGTLEISTDEELEELLLERESLQEANKRWNQIDGILKKRLVPGTDLAVGSFVIEWIRKQRKEMVIPASEYWQKKIERVGAGEMGGEAA